MGVRIVFCDPQSREVLAFRINKAKGEVTVNLIDDFKPCHPKEIEWHSRSTEIAVIKPPSKADDVDVPGTMVVSIQPPTGKAGADGGSFKALLCQDQRSASDCWEEAGLPLIKTLNDDGGDAPIIHLPEMPRQDDRALFRTLQEIKVIAASYIRKAAPETTSEDQGKRTGKVQDMYSIVSAFLMTMESELPLEFVGLIVKVFFRGLLARNDEKAACRLMRRFERPEVDGPKMEAHDQSMWQWIAKAFEGCRPIDFKGPSGMRLALQLGADGYVASILEDEDEKVYDLALLGLPDDLHAEEGVQIIEATQRFLLGYRDGSADPSAFVVRLHEITSKNPQNHDGLCARLHHALGMSNQLEAPLPVVQLLMVTIVLVLVDGETFKGLLEDPSRVSVLFSGRDLHSQRGMADPNFISAMMASHLTLNESGIVTACIACGKKLHDQDSARLGFGPECIKDYPTMLQEKKRLQESRKTKKRKRVVMVGGGGDEGDCPRSRRVELTTAEEGSADYTLQQRCQYALREDPGNAEMWYTLGAKAGGGTVTAFGHCTPLDCYRWVVTCSLEDHSRCFHAEAWIRLGTEGGGAKVRGQDHDATGCFREALAISKEHLPSLELRASDLLAAAGLR